jgi:Histidine kinase-, DNA gyrase B-, and HSP90-like ATPase
MPQRIPIQLHVGNALQWLGTLYRSPADALKEHVSNAIDEHLKAQLAGTAHERCEVRFTLDRKQVVIEYPYGMSRTEFQSALHRVADSAKRAGTARTIGRLGIGIFSFQQVGRKCTFFSRKTGVGDTLRVVLKEGSDEATSESALARDALSRAGLRVVISELKFDPTRPRGPLAPETLRRFLAEKFESYLREGWLAISIHSGVAGFDVTPPRLTLPRLMSDLRVVPLPGAATKRVRFDLHFDPSGKARVAIRHAGVTIVENVAAITAYGLEDTVWATGWVRGAIDADFLEPLPSRMAFDENSDWIELLDLLDRYRSTLQSEVDTHLADLRARQASEVGERALRIARDILDLDEFRDLALPGGLSKRRRPREDVTAATRPASKAGTRARSAKPGDKRSPPGTRIRYEEVPFESGSTAHSRFADGVVQANTLHADYAAASRSGDTRLAYAALLIGKETIAFNDRSGTAGDYLEKLLDFYFKLTKHTHRGRGKPRRVAREEQAGLDLES